MRWATFSALCSPSAEHVLAPCLAERICVQPFYGPPLPAFSALLRALRVVLITMLSLLRLYMAPDALNAQKGGAQQTNYKKDGRKTGTPKEAPPTKLHACFDWLGEHHFETELDYVCFGAECYVSRHNGNGERRRRSSGGGRRCRRGLRRRLGIRRSVEPRVGGLVEQRRPSCRWLREAGKASPLPPPARARRSRADAFSSPTSARCRSRVPSRMLVPRRTPSDCVVSVELVHIVPRARRQARASPAWRHSYTWRKYPVSLWTSRSSFAIEASESTIHGLDLLDHAAYSTLVSRLFSPLE